MAEREIEMPRETIITSRHPGDDNFNVKVGWNRDMDVQIGITESMDRSMWWVYGEKRKEELGSEIEKIVIEARQGFPEGFDRSEDIAENVLNLFDTMLGSLDSMWSTLSRKDINDLIRVLRRARDSAFGRDE